MGASPYMTRFRAGFRSSRDRKAGARTVSASTAQRVRRQPNERPSGCALRGRAVLLRRPGVARPVRRAQGQAARSDDERREQPRDLFTVRIGPWAGSFCFFGRTFDVIHRGSQDEVTRRKKPRPGGPGRGFLNQFSQSNAEATHPCAGARCCSRRAGELRRTFPRSAAGCAKSARASPHAPPGRASPRSPRG